MTKLVIWCSLLGIRFYYPFFRHYLFHRYIMRISVNPRHDLIFEGQGHNRLCECMQKPIVKPRSITKPVPSAIKGYPGNYNKIYFCQINRVRRNGFRNTPSTGRNVFLKISDLKECQIFPFYFWKDYPLAGGQCMPDHRTGVDLASE